jgi:predicted  nucleic acid-binding Zn-ribbon protein
MTEAERIEQLKKKYSMLTKRIDRLDRRVPHDAESKPGASLMSRGFRRLNNMALEVARMLNRSTVEYRDIEDKMFEIEEELDTYAERYGRSRDR